MFPRRARRIGSAAPWGPGGSAAETAPQVTRTSSPGAPFASLLLLASARGSGAGAPPLLLAVGADGVEEAVAAATEEADGVGPASPRSFAHPDARRAMTAIDRERCMGASLNEERCSFVFYSIFGGVWRRHERR